MQNTLSIGIRDNILLIRVSGEMRAPGCIALNEFLGPYLEKTDQELIIILDMAACSYMDSTSIGFILSLQTKCLKFMPRSVIISNPSEQCRGHLRKLHSLEKLEIKENALTLNIPVFELESSTTAFNSREGIELVFKAHTLLSDISEENRREFSDLLEELTRVLGSK